MPPGAGAAVGSLDGQAIATFQPVSVIPPKVAKRLPERNPAPDGRASSPCCRGLSGSGATGPAGELPSLPRSAHPNQRLLGGKPGLGSLGRRPPRRRRQAGRPRAEPLDTGAARGDTASDAAGPGVPGRNGSNSSSSGSAGSPPLLSQARRRNSTGPSAKPTPGRTARGEGLTPDPERDRPLHIGTPAGGGNSRLHLRPPGGA